MKLFKSLIIIALLLCVFQTQAQTKQGKCYETVVTPAVFSTETVEVEITPAYYETVFYQFVIKPAHMVWVKVGEKYCQVERPAVTKTASKKVLKTATVFSSETKFELRQAETIEMVMVACPERN